MNIHFGVKLYSKEGGFRLTADNYIAFRNKDFTSPHLEDLTNKYEKAFINFNYNMSYYKFLSREKFNEELNKLVDSYAFKEITDLNSEGEVKGYYIMVLDDYLQAYIGIAENIKRRIAEHWGKQVPLDKLANDIGILSLKVDCFRAFDTTRIFVLPCPECDFKNYPLISDNLENQMVNKLHIDYCLNQAMKGVVEEVRERLKNRDIRISKIKSSYHDMNCEQL